MLKIQRQNGKDVYMKRDRRIITLDEMNKEVATSAKSVIAQMPKELAEA